MSSANLENDYVHLWRKRVLGIAVGSVKEHSVGILKVLQVGVVQ